MAAKRLILLIAAEDFFETSGGAAIGSGFGNTKADYVNLAWASRSSAAIGAAWDLNQLDQVD